MRDAEPIRTLAAALAFAVTGWLASPARAANLDDAWVYKESISALAKAQNQWRYYPGSTNLVVCESLYTVGSNSREGCVARYLSQPWAPGVSPAARRQGSGRKARLIQALRYSWLKSAA